jgi:hypothetical protein
MAFPFSCRTLAPWKEDTWGFTTSAGFKHWLDHIAGTDAWTWGQLHVVREWCARAQAGDELYLDDDMRAVGPTEGEIMVRCNRPIVV